MTAFVRGCRIVVIALVLQAAAGAQSTKLSGPFLPSPDPAGDVLGFLYSPDGNHLVYRAGQDVFNVGDLYGRRLDGVSTPVKLNGPLAPQESIPVFVVSPDSSAVVYITEGSNGVKRLFVAPIDGSSDPLELGSWSVGTLAPREVFVSPDSGWVVFTAVADTRFDVELFSVPIDASSEPFRLHAPLSGSRGVGRTEISPDSSRVVFNVNVGQFAGNTFSSAIDGSAISFLGFQSEHFEIAPSSDFVYFPGHRVPLDGSASPQAVGPFTSEFALSPDENWIVYRTDELFSIPADGSASPVRLSDPPLFDNRDVVDFEISPDSSRVVYIADLDANETFEVYSVPIDGSAGSVELNGPLAAGGDVDRFSISLDSGSVVYRADEQIDGLFELFRTPLTGGSSLVLNGSLPPLADVDGFQITPDSSRVVYVADQDVLDVLELYSVPIDGSAGSVKLNTPFGPGGSIACPPPSSNPECSSGFLVSPTGLDVAFLAYEANLVYQLHEAPADGSTNPTVINDPLAFGPPPGDVLEFDVAPGGRWAVYLADQNVDGDLELFGVPVHGLRPAVCLSGLVTRSSSSNLFRISPDGRRVVYKSALAGPDALYSAPIDGITPPVELTPASTDFTIDFSIGPNGRVVYRTRFDVADPSELFSVPVDGSAGAILLDPGVDTETFELSQDGTLVLYCTDGSPGGLFVVPSDGSAAPTRLTPPAVDCAFSAGGYSLSPDGQLAAYIAAQDTPGQLELYVVPTDASSAPIKLSHVLPPLGDVRLGFQISPDGERVVYRAADDVGLEQLYSVPIDGSLAAVLLNDPLPTTSDIDEFAITPDGSYVVYRALQTSRFELFSVPIDRSSAPIRLNPLLTTSGEARDWRLDAQSSRACFRVVGANAPVQNGLYTAHLDGSLPAVWIGPTAPAYEFTPDGRRILVNYTDRLRSIRVDGAGRRYTLNSPPVPGGNIAGAPPFRITSDGARVVYRGTLEIPFVQELWSSPVGRQPIPSDPPTELVGCEDGFLP